MPHERYIDKNFSKSSKIIIAGAIQVIDEYQKQGFTLTLRQLYYQFVARGWIPNKQSEYKRIGSIINDARLAGYIDWLTIEDRTRNLIAEPHWEKPEDIIKDAARQFKIDKWATQPVRVEVWIEKDALVGVIEPVCNEFAVPFFACRGYSSQSEQWRAGKRMERYSEGGQGVYVLHLGDHDPSGIDMTRDNSDRLNMFSGNNVIVKRLALNYDQVEQYSPPPNPTKLTDSRAGQYLELHGGNSWELDALEPRVISNLIADEITNLRDNELWDEACAIEDEKRNNLLKAAAQWDAVEDFLEG